MSLLKMTSKSLPTKSLVYADIPEHLLYMFEAMPQDWQDKVKNQGYYMVFCDHGNMFTSSNGEEHENTAWYFNGLSQEKIESNPNKMTITELPDVTWGK